MIAISTNVLLRCLLKDEYKQSAKAAALLAGEEDVLLTHVVLSEYGMDTLRKKYNASQADVIATVHALFEKLRIVFENAKTVWRVLATM